MSELEYLTDYQLATRWGVSAQALYQRRRKDLGPPFKIIEGTPKYRLDTIIKWEREGRRLVPRRRNA